MNQGPSQPRGATLMTTSASSRGLPDNWHEMSFGTLWSHLNDPRRRPTPQSTIDAIICSLRERGLKALREPATAERIAHCDAAARKQIKLRIKKLGINDAQRD